MKLFQYFLVRFGLFALFAVPVFLLIALAQYCERKWDAGGLVWSLRIFGLATFLAAGWLSKRAANHYAFEQHSLYSSIKCALCEARILLSFLPLIGCWFASKIDKQREAHNEAETDDAA